MLVSHAIDADVIAQVIWGYEIFKNMDTMVKKGAYSSLWKPTTELRAVTCRM